MRRIIAFLAVLMPVLAGAPAGASQLADQSYRVNAGGRFVTEVSIDGQGPFSFVIDSAASRTLLYEHARAKLGLTRAQAEDLTVYGLNSVAKAMPVKPDSLTVAGEQITGMTLGVLPDNAREEAGIDGVLGIDVLARYFVVLDRSTMRLTLLAPDSAAAAPYRSWSATALTPRTVKNAPVDFWYVQGMFENWHFTSLFDLGAGFSLINWAAAEKLGLHKANIPKLEPPPAFLRDMLGTDEPVMKLTGVTIALDRLSWGKQAVVVANSDVFSRINLDGEPAAILGAGLLQNNSLAIDFPNHRLYVGPTEPPAKG